MRFTFQNNLFSIVILSIYISLTSALDLTAGDKDSVCEAAKYVVQGELNYYEGLKYGGTVGMFASPNYWWNAGEAFGGLLDYYTFCDNDNKTLKNLIYEGMYQQAGESFNYIPSNQSMVEGNDDQGVWGLAVMEAVERNFTDPEDHSWLSMTQAIFNTMEARWDTEHCGGGLRWQIFTWNSGYDYKNSIANGCLFNIAARLARFTRNESYAKVAEKVWDWMEDVGFLTSEDDKLVLHDGAKIGDNCTDVTDKKWSYTYGIFIAGCAYMYNYTEDSMWLDRATEIIEVSSYFFKDGIMYETTCMPNHCNNDQRSFHSLFARCLGITTVLAPETVSLIEDNLDKSAEAAAQSCSGGDDHVTCGEDWTKTGWDEVYGLGEQMCALEVMLATIVREFPVYTKDNGGSSKSNPTAGTNTEDQVNKNVLNISTKDKAGAGVLTAVVLGIVLGGSAWMAI